VPTALDVCGICFVLLLWQLAKSKYSVRRGDSAPTPGPGSLPLTEQKLRDLSSRPDHPGATDAESVVETIPIARANTSSQ
jgi:hypothetical protein